MESVEQRLTYRTYFALINELASSSIGHIKHIDSTVSFSRDFRQSHIEPTFVQHSRQFIEQTQMILGLHLNNGMAIRAGVLNEHLRRLGKRLQFAVVRRITMRG